MPVVRCPVHDVPYNDENPRGCPACWQDKVGKDPAGLMKELARASQAIPRVEILPPPTDDELPPMERLRTGAWPTPVTPPPRLPAPEPTRSERLAQTLRTHAVAVTSVGLVTVAAALMWYVSRPTFTPSTGTPRGAARRAAINNVPSPPKAMAARARATPSAGSARAPRAFNHRRRSGKARRETGFPGL